MVMVRRGPIGTMDQRRDSDAKAYYPNHLESSNPHLQAFTYLKALGSPLRTSAERAAAAGHLYEIACLLGIERTRSELIPFLADIVDGYPSFPLLPPILVEEGGAMPTLDWEAIESGTIAPPFNVKRRPTSSALTTHPDSRLFLLKTVISVSGSDWVNEVIAEELAKFMPKLFTPRNSINLVGVVSSLAASADGGVRAKAEETLLKLFAHFDDTTLLESGCVDLFLGMATSDCPFKKASVIPLLPVILEKLYFSARSAESKLFGEQRDLNPLKAEILKLFFEIPFSTKASLTRRVFVETLPKMMAILTSVAPNYNLDPLFVEKIQRSSSFENEKFTENPVLDALDMAVLGAADALMEDQTSEMRSLTAIVLATLSLNYFIREQPLDDESIANNPGCPLPTIRSLYRFVYRQSSVDEASKPDVKKPACQLCQFRWPTCSEISGTFSLKSDPAFNAMVAFESERKRLTERYQLAAWPHATKKKTDRHYPSFVRNVIRPYLMRFVNDDWVVRGKLVECLPTAFDLFLGHLPPEDSHNFLEAVWMSSVLDDENVDLRCAALKLYPLHCWLLQMSLETRNAYSTQLEAATQEAPSTNDDPAKECVEERSEPFISKLIYALFDAVNETDIRIRLAAAEIMAHFYVVLDDSHLIAKHLVTPVFSLLRDPSMMVLLSAIGAFHVLLSTPTDQDEISAAIPVGNRQFNLVEKAHKFLPLMEDALLVTLNSCLSATVMSQPSPDLAPTIIPLWRVRCAALHFLPDLDELFRFTSLERFNLGQEVGTVEGNATHVLLESIRGCLQDSVSSVRKCAAQALMELNRRKISKEFTQLLFGPILLMENEGTLLKSRIRIPLIGSALGELMKRAGLTTFEAAGWPEDLVQALLASLERMARDKVENIRIMVNSALEGLAPYLKK